MASGRLSSSVLGSSDVIHDFSCTPCSEDGKNMEAVTFCVNCQTYFCESCVGLHNKVLKSHNLLDQDAMKARTGARQKTRTELLKRDCLDHPGNVIQMFCGEHDLVCCTVCIAVDHRACRGVDFIPKVAKGILKSQERNKTRTSLQSVFKDILLLKTEKSKELSELNSAHEDILEEIQKVKERILERVDVLERNSVANVQKKYQEIADQLNSELKSIEELLRSTTEQIATLDQLKDNEAEVFVGIKCGQKVKTVGINLIQELKLAGPRKISFEFDNKLESAVRDTESFGTLLDNTSVPYTATLFGEYSCKTKDDIHKCLVFDSCVLDDGHVLLTDYNNEKLKRLDSSYTLTDYCKIDTPFGVCKTGPDAVAVSSCDRKKMCLVTIGKTMAVDRSFSVGEDCSGIAYHKGELFVACGGLHSNSSVKVYNLSGMHLRTLRYEFSAVRHLSIDHKGSNLFAADSDKGLIKLNVQGKSGSNVSVPCMKCVYGVSNIAGTMFVCCASSNNVIQFDKDGNMIKEILTATDGIESPVSATFATSPKHLIITFRSSNTVKVFKLS